MRRFLTEYVAEDGSRWAGPLILADSEEMAEALNVCLLGPTGQRLTILGEVILTLPAGGADTQVAVRTRH